MTVRHLIPRVAERYRLIDAGYDVVLATPDGTKPQIEVASDTVGHFGNDHAAYDRAKRFYAEDPAMNEVRTLHSIIDRGIKVFAPGGTVYSGTKFAVSAITEGLRQEVGDKIRVTSIEPGAADSDLKFSTSGTATEKVLDFYKQAIPAASVARAIAFAIEQPADVDINAIVIRPTAQQF